MFGIVSTVCPQQKRWRCSLPFFTHFPAQKSASLRHEAATWIQIIPKQAALATYFMLYFLWKSNMVSHILFGSLAASGITWLERTIKANGKIMPGEILPPLLLFVTKIAMLLFLHTALNTRFARMAAVPTTRSRTSRSRNSVLSCQQNLNGPNIWRMYMQIMSQPEYKNMFRIKGTF